LKNQKAGILNESKNIKVMKYQTGYLNNQLCKEGKRIFESIGAKFR
jgi:hypothetical protein